MEINPNAVPTADDVTAMREVFMVYNAQKSTTEDQKVNVDLPIEVYNTPQEANLAFTQDGYTGWPQPKWYGDNCVFCALVRHGFVDAPRALRMFAWIWVFDRVAVAIRATPIVNSLTN